MVGNRLTLGPLISSVGQQYRAAPRSKDAVQGYTNYITV